MGEKLTTPVNESPDTSSFEEFPGVASELRRNFPEIELKSLRYLDSGLANHAFLVNEEEVFRFGKDEGVTESIEREKIVLSAVKGKVSLPVAEFKHFGIQENGAPISGQTYIPGVELDKKLFFDADTGKFDEQTVKQLAQFFTELHSIDIGPLRAAGLPERDYKKYTEGSLRKIKTLLPVLGQIYPEDAQRIQGYAEALYKNYLSDEENFSYEPVLIHGDLESEHIKFDAVSRKITGVIDWGGTQIGDPAHELWRPYSHYGTEFMEQLLAHYDHPDHPRLYKKMDFMFRARVLMRAVEAVKKGDSKRIATKVRQVRGHALNQGYWYNEL